MQKLLDVKTKEQEQIKSQQSKVKTHLQQDHDRVQKSLLDRYSIFYINYTKHIFIHGYMYTIKFYI